MKLNRTKYFYLLSIDSREWETGGVVAPPGVEARLMAEAELALASPAVELLEILCTLPAPSVVS